MQVEAVLRQAEVVRWLAGSAAQQSDGSGGDPSALLHRLQLGHVGASSGAGTQVSAPPSALPSALACQLLQYCAHRPASVTVHGWLEAVLPNRCYDNELFCQ